MSARLEFSPLTLHGLTTQAEALKSTVVACVALGAPMWPEDRARAVLARALDAAYVDRLAVEVLGVRPRVRTGAAA